ARELLRICRTTDYGQRTTLVMNDRPDLALAAGFGGVHLGQDDISTAGARCVTGAEHLLGVSSHNVEQLRAAAMTDCDYVAIGPVFVTTSKKNPDPVVGVEGVHAARAVLGELAGQGSARKPLVAIGGIDRGNCLDVISAGADSIAVI